MLGMIGRKAINQRAKFAHYAADVFAIGVVIFKLRHIALKVYDIKIISQDIIIRNRDSVPDIEDDLVETASILLAVTFLGLLHFIVKQATRNAGSRFLSLDKGYILKQGNEPIFTVKPDLPHNPHYSFGKAVEDECQAIADIATNLFKGTVWGRPRGEKRRRVKAHLLKNPLSFFSIKNDGKLLGFTHILCVNQHTFMLYSRGELEHNKLHMSQIEAANSKDRFGLILFSMASPVKPWHEVVRWRKNKIEAGEVLTKILAAHIESYLATQFVNRDYVDITFHAFSKNVLRAFKGFKHEQRSKEGAFVITLRIENHKYLQFSKEELQSGIA